MIQDLPRLLIVSDLTLSFSQQGKSANPTLFNLFDKYPAELLMQFAPTISLINTPPASPFEKRYISFPSGYFPILKNRIGRIFVNQLFTFLNFQLLDFLPIPNLKRLENFAPEIILICPISPWCMLMGEKLTRYFNCPFVIYLMDDWIAVEQPKWISGSIDKIAYKLLKTSAGWLMISEQLQAELSSRYQLQPKRSLIAHNPVDLSGKEAPDVTTYRQSTFKVVYAGSIQVMHYDALAAVAEAIFELRREGKDIELVLHTAPGFWNFYKNKFQAWEVTYGSLIPYPELYNYLKRADLLLVVTSFLAEYAHMTRASVLTKLTDYMAAGKPILSCGPNYSACNRFIKQWGCGLVCETNQVSDIKSFLIDQMENHHSIQILAIKAFEVLKNNFSKQKISSELYKFIDEIYQENKT